MYKYLPISDSIKEMMVMLKSLPACTLVVDSIGRLIDMNAPALNIFKISSIHELDGSVLRLFPSTGYLYTVIRELKKGNTVREARILIRRKDGSMAAIEFSACMISGHRKLFLFQFFEISLVTNSDLGRVTYSAPKENNAGVGAKCWVENAENELVAKGARKPKLRSLTSLENVVNKFAAISMSVSEIAIATNKKEYSIRTTIRRIQEKQRLNFLDT